ncbi:MAG: acetyl-CoA carboxylase carboxyltransferase subunit alpha [Alphaproteobacteria bacterium]|nr:acetyl-CoA carboxylase carboxyltransferase subunit alpha [Alphaproteobacteria bacterium]
MDVVLDFERPIVELRKRIEQLRALHDGDEVNLQASIDQLELQLEQLQARTFSRLTAWQRTQIARHPGRPFTLDYLAGLCTEFTELHGDRAGYDDHAIVAGMARFRGRPVAVVGHQKGRKTKENIYRNFGMARPQGYRKALRVMKLADDFGLPVLTFVDTPGAYPGVEAEANGQAEAIARSILEMSRLTVPVVCVVTGEGGSGGALALATANRVLMLENSIYSVISPEGCAAILWRDKAEAPRASAALRVTARDCLELGVVDEVVPEPYGGAHRHRQVVLDAVGEAIGRHLDELEGLEPAALRTDRHDRFRRIGRFLDVA